MKEKKNKYKHVKFNEKRGKRKREKNLTKKESEREGNESERQSHMNQYILMILNTNKNDELYREARKITTVAYDYEHE